MRTLSATCVAIANAMKSKTLEITEEMGREVRNARGEILLPAEPYWTIGDSHGTIEVCLSLDELNERIAQIEGVVS